MPERPAQRRGLLALLSSTIAVSIALVVLLLSLGALVWTSNVKVAAALGEEGKALMADRSFSQAQLSVATEALAVRAYRAEPSIANRDLLRAALGSVTQHLFTTLQENGLAGTVQELQLSTAQQDVQVPAEQMIRLQANDNAGAQTVADDQVLPAATVLQAGLDRVAEQFHARSAHRLEQLRQIHRRTLLLQAAGGVVGAIVVCGVLRLLWLGQRRERLQAKTHEHAALHDSLTDLPNRAHFMRALDEVLGERGSGARPTAVALIDLDDFKAINDSFGHVVGDTVLIAMAAVLRGCVGRQDLVARLGGDEFVVILRDRDPKALQTWVQRTTRALRRDVHHAQGTVAVSGSVGLSLVTSRDDAQSISHRADLAMYHAKTEANLRLWSVDAQDSPGVPSAQEVDGDLFGAQLSSELKTLLDDGDPAGQLELHYQPRIHLAGDRVCGAEALVRWRHPAHGLLVPAQFLFLALAPALQTQFTHLVLRRAVDQAPLVLAALVQSHAATPDPVVSVNVSASGLADGSARDLPSMLIQAGIAAHSFRVEIGQLAACSDLTALEAAVTELRAMGIRSTLDDFGFGEHEVPVLRRLPVDEVKIDRRLVHSIRNVRGSALDERILRATVAVARALGIRATAQGADNDTTLQLLRHLGFEVIQGHHLAPPVRAADLSSELRRMRRDVLELQRQSDVAVEPVGSVW